MLRWWLQLSQRSSYYCKWREQEGLLWKLASKFYAKFMDEDNHPAFSSTIRFMAWVLKRWHYKIPKKMNHLYCEFTRLHEHVTTSTENQGCVWDRLRVWERPLIFKSLFFFVCFFSKCSHCYMMTPLEILLVSWLAQLLIQLVLLLIQTQNFQCLSAALVNFEENTEGTHLRVTLLQRFVICLSFSHLHAHGTAP